MTFARFLSANSPDCIRSLIGSFSLLILDAGHCLADMMADLPTRDIGKLAMQFLPYLLVHALRQSRGLFSTPPKQLRCALSVLLDGHG